MNIFKREIYLHFNQNYIKNCNQYKSRHKHISDLSCRIIIAFQILFLKLIVVSRAVAIHVKKLGCCKLSVPPLPVLDVRAPSFLSIGVVLVIFRVNFFRVPLPVMQMASHAWMVIFKKGVFVDGIEPVTGSSNDTVIGNTVQFCGMHFLLQLVVLQ